MEGGGGGSGSGINSVVEAEFRARKQGGPPHPDAAEVESERKARLAAWVLAGLAAVGLTWLFVGLNAAAIVLAVIAAGSVGVWWIRRRIRAETLAPETNPRP